jgi:hypothetical protein
MQVKIFSIRAMQDIYRSINVPFIIISIVSNDFDNPIFWPTDYLKSTCYLKFYDIGPTHIKEGDIYQPLYKGLFNPIIANKIIDFVELHKDEVELIAVHCEAGISRSAAVAAVISKMLNGDDSDIFNNRLYLPNMFVYSMLLEIWHYRKQNEDKK